MRANVTRAARRKQTAPPQAWRPATAAGRRPAGAAGRRTALRMGRPLLRPRLRAPAAPARRRHKAAGRTAGRPAARRTACPRRQRRAQAAAGRRQSRLRAAMSWTSGAWTWRSRSGSCATSRRAAARAATAATPSAAGTLSAAAAAGAAVASAGAGAGVALPATRGSSPLRPCLLARRPPRCITEDSVWVAPTLFWLHHNKASARCSDPLLFRVLKPVVPQSTWHLCCVSERMSIELCVQVAGKRMVNVATCLHASGVHPVHRH